METFVFLLPGILFIVAIIGSLILVFATVGLAFFRMTRRCPSPQGSALRIGLVSMAASSIAFAIYMVMLILRLRSSTSGIWFFAVPVYSLLVGAGCFAVTWSLSLLTMCTAHAIRHQPLPKRRHTICAVLALGGSALVFGGYAYSEHLRSRATNLSATEEQLRDLFKHPWAKRDRFVVRALVKNRNCPADILLELARLDARPFREQRSSLRDLMENDFHAVLEHAAASPNTTAQAFVHLARSRSEDVRRAVARSPYAPPSVLAGLANDAHQWVVYFVAGNTNTPPEILAELSNHVDLRIKRRVAGNTGTPPATLKELSRHQDVEMRRAVAENPSTPREALESLVDDSDEMTKTYARRNLATIKRGKGGQLRSR